MTAGATVSVIIPTFNRAELLVQTLESVLSQTRPPKEIVVVDDGSTDQTPQLMASYCSRDDRIRYLQQSGNRGADRARQVGFEASRGDYVAFLDSDDLWLPTHLERCLAGLKERPGAAMAFTRYGVIDLQGRVLVPQIREPHLSASPVRMLLFKEPLIQYSRAVYARGAVREVGGVPASVASDDWVLDVLIAYRWPEGVVAIPSCTVWSRFHAGKSASYPEMMHRSLLAATEQIFEALPPAWASLKPRVVAINFLHSAVAYWHAQRQREAWQCLVQAVRGDPSCIRINAFWSALARVSVHASLSRVLRDLKHGIQRRAHLRSPLTTYRQVGG